MKIKTVERIINDKFDSWVKTITDERVKKLVQQNSILTGGSICSLLLNEPVNDFDFYFKDKETTKAVAEYYVNLFKSKRRSGSGINIEVKELEDRIKIFIKSAGVTSETETNNYQYFEGVTDSNPDLTSEYVSDLNSVFNKNKKENVYLPIFLSCNAITLSDDVQLVVRFFGDPETIHQNYDFVHCMNYWESNTRKIVTKHAALEAILGRELKYVGSLYPIASLFRIRKFIKRGWHITAGQMLKIAMQVSKLDLTNFNVLEEQLIGVDVAYFSEIIAKLKETNSDKIDDTYLVKLIDEMF